jgi:hypothetical protein
MYYEGVQHLLWFCLDHYNCVNMVAFRSWKQKNYGGPSQASRVGVGCVVFGQGFPGKKEVRDGVLSWSDSQFFCRQSSGWSVRTLSCSCHETLQQYVKLTVWPARMNPLWTIPLTLLCARLAFFSLPWTENAIQTVMYGSCFFPGRFVIIARVFIHFFRNLHKMY